MITELESKLNKIKIIDIRDNFDTKYGMIGNAINIERKELLLNHKAYLCKDHVYYIYCNSGKYSKEVVKKLNKMGYKTVDIVGGYIKWLAYIDS